MKLFFTWLPGLMLAGLLGMASLPAAADDSQTLSLDPYHTQVRVTWNHLGFSNPGASFDVGKGILKWNADDPGQSSIRVTIPVASVNTQVPALDAKLQSSDFFDAKQYPTITFKSTDVTQIGKSRRYRIEGELTMHGITRPATLQATLNGVGEHPMLHVPAVGFDATTTIKRSAFGLGAATPLVSDQVRIHITVEAVPPQALAKEKQEVEAMNTSD